MEGPRLFLGALSIYIVAMAIGMLLGWLFS